MYELLKTIVIMSGLGFCPTALLLILKPITVKRFPAKWQYCAWIAVLLFMTVPVWRLIPQQQASKIIRTAQYASEQAAPASEQNAPAAVSTGIPIEQREITLSSSGGSVRVSDILCCVWLGGMSIFLLAVAASYVIYLCGKRKKSVDVADNAVLQGVKAELGIKRKIKVRMSSDISSPLLCGVLFPIVYIPCADMPEEKLRMVFLHELTHYKRKDLAVKWIAVFVNAVHWFNPLAYLLTANIGEACEVSCDMRVTRDMSEANRTLYMKTILDMI